METLIHLLRRTVNEKHVWLLICLLIGFYPISSAINHFIVLPLRMDIVLIYTVTAIVIIFAGITIITRIKEDSYFMIAFFIISYMIPVIWFGFDFANWFKVGVMLFVSVSSYAIARSINEYSNLKSYLSITAILIGASSFLVTVFVKLPPNEAYSQFRGYITLPALIISTSLLFDKFKPLHLLNAILSFMVIIASGARGPLVCFLLFGGIKILFHFLESIKLLFHNQMPKKKLLVNICFLCVIGFLIVNNYQNVRNFFTTASVYGSPNRLVSMIAGGKLLEDYSRTQLLEKSKHLITDNPILGLGIYRDRLSLANFLHVGSEGVVGCYPHNIFLEIPLHFGLIAGSVMFLCFFMMLYYALIKNRNKDAEDIILIFTAIGLFPLFFSGSYTQSPLLFLLVGFCVNVAIKENNH